MSSTTTPPGLGPATTMRKERESWGSFLAGSRGFLTHAAQSVSGPALTMLSSTPSFKLIAPLAPGPSRGWRGPALKEWNRGPRAESRPIPPLACLAGDPPPQRGRCGRTAALAGGGQGGRLDGGALSSISAIGGGGTRGETEGAGPRGPRRCPPNPSRGGPGAARNSGAGRPGSSARRSTAVSGEVRAPGGAGAFPTGARAVLNLGPP